MRDDSEVFCDTCHGQVGHQINCPHGIATSGKATSMTHTATPWTWGIEKQTKQIIIAHECHCEGLCPDFGGMVLIEGECLGEEDAQRIVACVNALAGIRPEAVREMREALRNLNTRVIQYMGKYEGEAFEALDDYFAGVLVAASVALKAAEE